MNGEKIFQFELGQTVDISVSGESGKVIGRADYLHAEPAYYVRYKSSDGRAVEDWWTQQSLGAHVKDCETGEA